MPKNARFSLTLITFSEYMIIFIDKVITLGVSLPLKWTERFAGAVYIPPGEKTEESQPAMAVALHLKRISVRFR